MGRRSDFRRFHEEPLRSEIIVSYLFPQPLKPLHARVLETLSVRELQDSIAEAFVAQAWSVDGEIPIYVFGIGHFSVTWRSVNDEIHRRPSFDLTKLSTRELLKWLANARRFGGWYSPCDSKSPFRSSFEEIKAELSKREHIPNKAESRFLRQQAARLARKSKARHPRSPRCPIK